MSGNPRSLPDIQAQVDVRGLPIQAVGVKGVRCPIVVRSGGRDHPTVAPAAMTVVDDLVRDVALGLRMDPRVGHFVVQAENFESIHNHSAPALAIGRAA